MDPKFKLQSCPDQSKKLIEKIKRTFGEPIINNFSFAFISEKWPQVRFGTFSPEIKYQTMVFISESIIVLASHIFDYKIRLL